MPLNIMIGNFRTKKAMALVATVVFTFTILGFGKPLRDITVLHASGKHEYDLNAPNTFLSYPNSQDEGLPRKDCIPLALAVDCSSEKIRVGKPVICKVRSDASENAPIAFKWSVSLGASQGSRTGKSVRVLLTDTTKPKIKVTAKVVSPKVCFDTASMELQVDKPKIRPKRH